MIDASQFAASTAEQAEELQRTLKLTLERGWQVSFPLLAQAHYLQNPVFTSDPKIRDSAAQIYPSLLEAFVKRHGAIVKETYASHLVGAVALTADDTIHMVYNLDASSDPRAVELLFRCDALYREAKRLIWGKYLFTTAHVLYSVESQLVALLDQQKKDGSRDIGTKQLAILQREFERARLDWDNKAANTGNFQYLLGMLTGVGALAVVIPLIGVGLALSQVRAGTDAQALFGSSIGGGAGALVSVLTRMSQPGVRLDYLSGRAAMFLQGLFRPLLGSLFGLVVFVLLAGGLLPITVPGGAKAFYFFAGAAFIAGFSERIAKGLVSTAGSVIATQSESVGTDSAAASPKAEGPPALATAESPADHTSR